jgi:hypothetical protein
MTDDVSPCDARRAASPGAREQHRGCIRNMTPRTPPVDRVRVQGDASGPRFTAERVDGPSSWTSSIKPNKRCRIKNNDSLIVYYLFVIVF